MTATKKTGRLHNGCVIATCDDVLRTNVEEGAEGYEACDDGNHVDEDEA